MGHEGGSSGKKGSVVLMARREGGKGEAKERAKKAAKVRMSN